MTDKTSISKYRSEVIERSINIEALMDSIISQHYFKRVVMEFLLEVLYDEYFSFALKRRIIEKIIDNIDQQQLQNLNRVNTIRNYFAHVGQDIFYGKTPPSKDRQGSIPDPRRPDRSIDFKKLYDEFNQIFGNVERYLASVYCDKGGELFAYINDKFVKVKK